MSDDATPAKVRLTDGLGALVERLRNASHGYDEWRVQDPADGSYCIAYSWPETINPEREARAWLADHKARFPGGLHSDYVVACVRVMPEKDRLLLEAAAMLERLQPMDMALCEQHSLVLRVGQPYVFSPVGDCESCAEALRQAVDAYGPSAGAPNAEFTGIGRNGATSDN